MNKQSFKSLFSFEFWQKFGKALMVVIAVMPAAGLMISLGKTIAMINPELGFLVTTGGVLEQIGWGVIVNLHILFALAIGGSWAKERAGGAFAAGHHWCNIRCNRRYAERSRSEGEDTSWWIYQGC